MEDSDPVLSFHFVSLQCSYLILPSKTLSSLSMNLWTWPALSSPHACSEHSLQLRVLAITECLLGLPDGTSGKELACQGRRRKRCRFNPGSGKSPGNGNGNPVHYSLPWTEEPARLQSMGLQRFGRDLAACTTAYYVSLCTCFFLIMNNFILIIYIKVK